MGHMPHKITLDDFMDFSSRRPELSNMFKVRTEQHHCCHTFLSTISLFCFNASCALYSLWCACIARPRILSALCCTRAFRRTSKRTRPSKSRPSTCPCPRPQQPALHPDRLQWEQGRVKTVVALFDTRRGGLVHCRGVELGMVLSAMACVCGD